MSSSIWRQKIIQSGCCIVCAKPRENTIPIICLKCKKRANELRKKRNVLRISNNECIQCSKSNICNNQLCPDCSKKVANASIKRTKKLILLNKCATCGQNGQIKLKKRSYCIKCYCNLFACRRLQNYSLGPILLNMLIKQNFMCAISGIKLELGKNASLDHIIPKTLGGTNDIDNLQWVDKTINFMKHNLNMDDFVKFCKLIANKYQ